jgi:hypothetical protein
VRNVNLGSNTFVSQCPVLSLRAHQNIKSNMLAWYKVALPCLAIVFAEAGNRLEVWHQAGGQPHQLDIALCLDLQASGGLDAVEVTIDIQLQQRGRVIDRSAGYFRSTPANPNLSRSRLST